MRADLHVHTRYSEDSLTGLDSLVRWMARRSMDVVAITDHNAIDGALEAHARYPERFIVGEEVQSSAGDICGLFLHELVPSGLTPLETVARVHAQGGLVYLPHPFDGWRGLQLGADDLAELLQQTDIVEALNARVGSNAANRRAAECARRLGIPCAAGSDAHLACEVGRAYVDVPPFTGPTDLLAALAHGQVSGKRSGAWVHLGSRAAYWYRHWRPHAASHASDA